MSISRILREPLLHFLLIGLGLFIVFNIVSGNRGGADRHIVVNDANGTVQKAEMLLNHALLKASFAGYAQG